jgi:hypothetical protein
MRKLFLVLVAVLSLTGCKLFTKTVYVPQPPPPVVAEPQIRVAELPITSTWMDVSTAYKLDLAEWVAYGRKLETLLWGSTTPAPKPEPKP